MQSMTLMIWNKGDDLVRLVENLNELRFNFDAGSPFAPVMLGIITDTQHIEALVAKLQNETLIVTPCSGADLTIDVPLDAVRKIKAYWFDDGMTR